MRDNDREAYEKFFENFGRGLKYGIYSSYGMKADELADLLLFWSAKEQKMITLAEYAKGMPEDQKAIYYAAGDSRERLAKMPVVKGVLDRGYDVLLLTQDVDEFTFQAMREYVRRLICPRSTRTMLPARLPRRPLPTVLSPRSMIVTWSSRTSRPVILTWRPRTRRRRPRTPPRRTRTSLAP